MAQAIILRTSTPIGALTPAFEGQKVVDTTNDLIYIAYGLTNADWQEVGSGGGGIYPGAFNDYGFLSTAVTINVPFDDANIFHKATFNDQTFIINFQQPTDLTKAYFLTFSFEDGGGFATPTIQYNGVTMSPTGLVPSFAQGIIEAKFLASQTSFHYVTPVS